MEFWKDVAGYEGIYQASNQGRIRSLDREREFVGRNQTGKPFTYTRKHKGKILAGGLDKNGYRIGVFYDKDGKRRTHKFHRLIAQTLIPNPDNLPEVNHDDGNKQNNEISNLEWTTTRKNIQHAFDTGLKESYGKKPVVMLDKDTLEVLKVYDSIQASVADGFNRNHVGGCCRGDIGRRTHKGYRWCFLHDLERATTIRKE